LIHGGDFTAPWEPKTDAPVALAMITQEKNLSLAIQPRVVRDQMVARIMQAVFVLIPLLTGLDKFFNLMTNWDHYVSPLILQIVPFSAQQIMLASGPVEMLIGIIVAIKPRLGSLMVACMLFGIMLNLLTMPKQLHIAFLDLSLAVLAVALFVLSRDVD